MANDINKTNSEGRGNTYLQSLEKRFRNPLFLTAFVGIVYNALKHFGITIPEADFRTIADVISYLFMGVGIYASYGDTDKQNKDL